MPYIKLTVDISLLKEKNINDENHKINDLEQHLVVFKIRTDIELLKT